MHQLLAAIEHMQLSFGAFGDHVKATFLGAQFSWKSGDVIHNRYKRVFFTKETQAMRLRLCQWLAVETWPCKSIPRSKEETLSWRKRSHVAKSLSSEDSAIPAKVEATRPYFQSFRGAMPPKLPEGKYCELPHRGGWKLLADFDGSFEMDWNGIFIACLTRRLLVTQLG